MNNNPLKVAVVQSAPELFDLDKTMSKILKLIDEASEEGANLIVFPESYIPAYPRGLSFGMVVGSRTMEGRADFKRYYDNSIEVPGRETEILSKVCIDKKIYLSMGITEKDKGSLYCTNIFFTPEGYEGKHRKLKPTGTERTLWGEGDSSTLTTVHTPWGVMGSLICWENYMPLARMAMYDKDVSIYLAPTADSREEWQSTMKHIALEGRCFVIGCNQYVEKSMYPTDLNYYHELEKEPEVMCRGGSCIVNPYGKYVIEPHFGSEKILYAQLDLNQVIESRLDFHVNGHYSRSDVFHFKVK